MKAMPAGQFKARCLSVMEEVRKYRTPVLITKKGRPVAKLVPVDSEAVEIFGCMTGTARIIGDVEAPVIDAETWDTVAGPKTPGRRRPPRSRGEGR